MENKENKNENICDLAYVHNLISKIELFAKVHGLNFDIKIYDADFNNCTTIKYDIAN